MEKTNLYILSISILLTIFLFFIINQYQEIENENSELKAQVDSLNAINSNLHSQYMSVINELNLISTVDVTMYQPVESQTDDTPLLTADMSVINPDSAAEHKWIAVSRDLHARYGGDLHFGDYVLLVGTIEQDGIYQVRDLMNARFNSRIDILMGEYDSPFRYSNIKLYQLPQNPQVEYLFANSDKISYL
mgnify:CR=1 FL=1